MTTPLTNSDAQSGDPHYDLFGTKLYRLSVMIPEKLLEDIRAAMQLPAFDNFTKRPEIFCRLAVEHSILCLRESGLLPGETS